MKRFLTLAVAAASLAGCAQSYQPVVDTKGHDTARYQQDLYECRQYAERTSPVQDAAVGGLGGAAAGADGQAAGRRGGGLGLGRLAEVLTHDAIDQQRHCAHDRHRLFGDADHDAGIITPSPVVR